MPTNRSYRLTVHLAGLENSRDQMAELALFVDGSGLVLQPIRLQPECTSHDLLLPAGMYFLRVKFTICRKAFSRSLSAITVPGTTSVRFDLAQAITDALAGSVAPAEKLHHRPAARMARV